MLLSRVLFSVPAFVYLSCAQDVITVLEQQSSISQFFEYLQQYPDLVEQLNGGKYTILAPNNAAFNVFEQNSRSPLDEGLLLALLQYHIIRESHASQEFATGPFFPATLLTNTSYTNVTGGQRVECTSLDGKPVVISGLKAVSNIVEPDLIFVGGLVQVIDNVLTIPLNIAETYTRAGLSDLIALLTKGGFLSDPQATEIVLDMPDVSSFAPNSSEYGANYTGFDGLTKGDLQSVLNYCTVQRQPVLYSTMLKNNSKFETLPGKYLTITELDGELYVDSSRIIVRDYLVTNGVVQVLDSLLNPNTTNARPMSPAMPLPESLNSKGLTFGDKAAIGVVVAILTIGAGTATKYLLRRRKDNRALGRLGSISRPDSDLEVVSEKTSIPRQRGHRQLKHERGSKESEVKIFELGPPYTPPELDEARWAWRHVASC